MTPTQKNFQAQQMLEINAQFGREVFPASMIIKDMNIQGKSEIMQYLQQQEEQANHKQNDMEMVQHAIEDAKLKELYSKAVANIAMARERHGRSESNLGLYEERLSMIERNRALSLKEKQLALGELLENIHRFGEIETTYQDNKLKVDESKIRAEEEFEKRDAERRSEANKFIEQLMGKMNNQNGQQMPEQQLQER